MSASHTPKPMNVKLLIDAVIHQTTVLIAHLATSAGLRAPLAHVANQVFLDLVTELEAQGVGRKVIADMFGLALRSYQLKVRRLSESTTDQSRSLWEAVLEFVQQRPVVTRAEVLTRFARDDESSVRGILHDLVESGLVFRAGRGHSTTYRAATEEELGVTLAADPASTLEAMAWVTIYREGPLDADALAEKLGVTQSEASGAAERLIADGRVSIVSDASASADKEAATAPRYTCQTCVLPMGEASGWEAAVFDHYQSMVAALCTKLRGGDTCSLPRDVIGGSTYSFDVWPGHPHEAAIYGLLREHRAQASALRKEVTAHNDAVGRPAAGRSKVVFYVGQNVIQDVEGHDTT